MKIHKLYLPFLFSLASFSRFNNILCYVPYSEDDLLCTHSSSPLLLLTSGFGVEVSSSLHELQDLDDVMKLSGYISGPCNSFTMKVNYIYDMSIQSFV